MGGGTDVALDCADNVLLNSELGIIPDLAVYSKRVESNIRTNLLWAFFYNTLGIPIAAGALFIPFGISLTPMLSSAAMSLSSLFVVSNALRLYKGDFK